MHRQDFATNVNPDWTALLQHFEQGLHSLLFYSCKTSLDWFRFYPIAPRKAKIVYSFGLSVCNRLYNFGHSECNKLYYVGLSECISSYSFGQFCLSVCNRLYNFGLSKCNKLYNFGLSEFISLYNFGLSECNRFKGRLVHHGNSAG